MKKLFLFAIVLVFLGCEKNEAIPYIVEEQSFYELNETEISNHLKITGKKPIFGINPEKWSDGRIEVNQELVLKKAKISDFVDSSEAQLRTHDLVQKGYRMHPVKNPIQPWTGVNWVSGHYIENVADSFGWFLDNIQGQYEHDAYDYIYYMGPGPGSGEHGSSDYHFGHFRAATPPNHVTRYPRVSANDAVYGYDQEVESIQW